MPSPFLDASYEAFLLEIAQDGEHRGVREFVGEEVAYFSNGPGARFPQYRHHIELSIAKRRFGHLQHPV